MPPYNKSPPSILSGNHSSDFYFCNSAFSRSYLYQFPKSAETKCQKIGDLNNTNLLSQSPRRQKPVTAISRVGFFGEQWQKTLVQAAFLGVQMAISSLCLHIISRYKCVSVSRSPFLISILVIGLGPTITQMT